MKGFKASNDLRVSKDVGGNVTERTCNIKTNRIHYAGDMEVTGDFC